MKKISYIFFIVSALFLGYKTHAQQQSLFTNYLLNPSYYNPAFAGSESMHRLNLNYRNQWSGFEGAPKTLSVSLFGSVKDKMKHGYGAMVYSDNFGLTNRTGVYLNYAHQFKINKTTRLGLGITPGLFQYRIRLYDARLADQGDDLLTGNILNQSGLDINAGAHVYNEKFFVAASFNQLLSNIDLLEYNDQLTMHYNLMGGYTLPLNKTTDLQFSTLMRYTKNVPFSADISAKGIFNKNLWVALTYRTTDALSLGVGYILKERLWIGYSYDYSYSSMSAYQNGSHEIAISFALTKKKKTIDEEDEELNNSIMEGLKKKNKEELK